METSTSVTTSESTLSTPDGTDLYTKTWHPPSHPKARLVFLHGFSDHCNFYDPFFPELARAGIKVYSFDQRGWGRSVHRPSQKGLTGGTKQVMDDITLFIKSLPSDESDVPLFLMGHSMGGGEVLYYMATGPEDVKSSIRGFLCESPWVALHKDARPSKTTIVLARLTGKLLPHRHMMRKLDSSKICRDPDVCRAFEADSLCHDVGTLEGLAGMLDRADELEHGRVKVTEGVGEGAKTRLWIGYGTGDGILDEDACRKWFQGTQIEDKEYRRYEGWYHRLHSEPGDDKYTFAADVAKWILDRSGSDKDALEAIGKPKL